MTRPGIELRSPGPLANTLTIISMTVQKVVETTKLMTSVQSIEYRILKI